MTGPKDKPVLYELVSKGPLKTDQQGGLKAPGWFQGDEAHDQAAAKPQTTATTGAGSQSVVAAPPKPVVVVTSAAEAAPKPAVPAAGSVRPAESSLAAVPPVRPLETVQPQRTTPVAAATMRSVFDLAARRLGFSLPYWAVGVVVLGAVICLVLAFELGQARGRRTSGLAATTGSASGKSPSAADSGPEPALQEIMKQPPQPGVLGRAQPLPAAGGPSSPGGAQPGRASQPAGSTPGPTTEAAGPAPQAAPGAAGMGQPAAGGATAAGKGAFCLILCGDQNRRNLLAVQEYFTKAGVLTNIGRAGSRYVLYADQGTDNSQSVEAQNLKRRVAELGGRYYRDKPKNAPTFVPSTFESAYWMSRSAITLGE